MKSNLFQRLRTNAWDRDSHNGDQPTQREMGWDGSKHTHRDKPQGRFNGGVAPPDDSAAAPDDAHDKGRGRE
jgi:hypothetical protein